MVMTFVLTPRSHYNTITEPRAHFLLSLMEGLSIDFPSDCYQNTVTHDKLIFPSAITHILTHLHVTIPPSPHFYVIGAISKEYIRRSVAQLTKKWPHVGPSDAAPANPIAPSSRPSSSSAPSSSSQAVISLVNIMEKFQHMHADFGSRLDHLSDEMCQMNTKIGRIAHRQSGLGGFSPSPSLEHVEESSSSNGENDDGGNAFGSVCDDEMKTSQ